MYRKSSFNIVFFITICTLLGKVLGLVRDMVISYYYGTSSETDSFFLAMSIPTLILGVFTSSTDSAIIPQYKRIMADSTKEIADRLFSVIVNHLSIIAILMSICIFVWPEWFVGLFATGFSVDNIEKASAYLRIFAPIGFFHLLYCFFCTYNAIFKKNKIRSILAFSTNVIVVFSLIFIRDEGLNYLTYAYLFANFICAFLPLLEMNKLKYRYAFIWMTNIKEYKKFWFLFIPIMGSALLNNIQQYVDKNLCSDIQGGISYLVFGNKLVNIFDGVLVVGIGVVILPLLSDYENNRYFQDFSKVASKVTRLMIEILFIFFSILFIMSDELITLLYGRGQFDETAINVVSNVLTVYSPLILLLPIITIFSKFFHVKEKNKIPFYINLVGVVINVILSILFKYLWGVVGVALATSVALVIEICIYVRLIDRYIEWDLSEINIPLLIKMCIPFAISLCICSNLPSTSSLVVISGIKLFVVASIFGTLNWLFLRDDFYYWKDRIYQLVKR